MNINSINDVILSTATNSTRSQEINFKFIYNNYIENETTFDDNIILDRNAESKNRFIRIEIENNIEENSVIPNIRQTFEEIEASNLRQFINKNLTKEEREFFNKMDNLFSDRKTLILDNKFEEINKYSNFYSSDQKNIEEDTFSLLNYSRELSLTKNKNYEKKFINKSYPESFNFNNLKDYNSLVDSESISRERSKESHVEKFKTGNLLPGLNYFSETINLGDINSYANKNALYCGVYVEKFLLEDDKYNFLCSKFYLNDAGKASFDIVPKIEDEAVKYGKTYRYVCYNTYIYTTVRPDNRFILRHYLLCQHPYISNDIVCREFDPPPEPVCLNVDYDFDRKRLVLTWEEPTNYEGDVKGYQILKRHSIKEPYVIVKQLEAHLPTDLYEPKENVPDVDIEKSPGDIKKIYFDFEFDNTKMCIYTIRSIDAHGMFSNYGEQIGIYYDILRNSLIKSLVAKTGAPVMYPNHTLLNKSVFHENIADFVDNLPIIKKPQKFSLYLTPDFVYIKDNETLKKSLDDNYQITLTNLNDFAYKTNKFSIVNFK